MGTLEHLRRVSAGDWGDWTEDTKLAYLRAWAKDGCPPYEPEPWGEPGVPPDRKGLWARIPVKGGLIRYIEIRWPGRFYTDDEEKARLGDFRFRFIAPLPKAP